MTTYRTYRRMEIKLVESNDGFWGWVIGNDTLLPSFSYFSSAFHSAKLHIDQLKLAV